MAAARHDRILVRCRDPNDSGDATALVQRRRYLAGALIPPLTLVVLFVHGQSTFEQIVPKLFYATLATARLAALAPLFGAPQNWIDRIVLSALTLATIIPRFVGLVLIGALAQLTLGLAEQTKSVHLLATRCYAP